MVIEEHQKTRMIAAGRWVAENPGAPIRGYDINCLYYPMGLGPRWIELVAMWRDAQGDQAKLKTFINDRLAEPWEDPAMRGAGECDSDAQRVCGRRRCRVRTSARTEG